MECFVENNDIRPATNKKHFSTRWSISELFNTRSVYNNDKNIWLSCCQYFTWHSSGNHTGRRHRKHLRAIGHIGHEHNNRTKPIKTHRDWAARTHMYRSSPGPLWIQVYILRDSWMCERVDLWWSCLHLGSFSSSGLQVWWTVAYVGPQRTPVRATVTKRANITAGGTEMEFWRKKVCVYWGEVKVINTYLIY